MEHPPLKLAHKMVDKSQLGLIDFQVSVSRQTKAAAVAAAALAAGQQWQQGHDVGRLFLVENINSSLLFFDADRMNRALFAH